MNIKNICLFLLVFVMACTKSEIEVPIIDANQTVFFVSSYVSGLSIDDRLLNLSLANNNNYINSIGVKNMPRTKQYFSELGSFKCNAHCSPSIKFTLVDELLDAEKTGNSTFRKGIYRFVDREKQNLDVYQVRFINNSESLTEGSSVFWRFEEASNGKQTAEGIDTIILNLFAPTNNNIDFFPELRIKNSLGEVVSLVSQNVNLEEGKTICSSEMKIVSSTETDVTLQLKVKADENFKSFWFWKDKNLNTYYDTVSSSLVVAKGTAIDAIAISENTNISFYRDISIEQGSTFSDIPKFDASVSVLPNASKFQLSRFNIEYTENGIVYKNVIQDESTIKVMHIEKYIHQYNGMPTLAVDLLFSCTLQDINGNSITFENGRAKLAFNYIN